MTTRIAAAVLILAFTAVAQTAPSTDKPESPVADKSAATTKPVPGLFKISKIFLSPASDETGSFEHQLLWQLIETEKAPKHMGDLKLRPKGDCSTGYPSVIPGIVLVCTEKEADAILFATGDSNGGMARLRDKATGDILWEATRTALLNSPRYRTAQAAEKVVKQLRKDVLAARKERN